MKKTLWALFDDRMGSVGQAKGIIQAIGDDFAVEVKNIVYNRFAALPNCLLGASKIGVNQACSDSLDGPYPDLILSISRRTTPIARFLKKKSGGKSKIVQLMYPGKCGIKELDLVIVSEHDHHKCHGDNLFFVTGCSHRVTPEALAEAKEKWEESFAHLPRPFTAVIVGGAIKGRPFSAENAHKLGQAIKNLHNKTGGSILITTSRRTGNEAEKIIMEEIAGIPAYTYLWGEEKENPIMGFWALGDRIVVTGDTVSMCSESCGSGKPVLIFCGSGWLRPKHMRFVQSLYDGGYAAALEDENALTFKPKERLDPAAKAAEKILDLF